MRHICLPAPIPLVNSIPPLQCLGGGIKEIWHAPILRACGVGDRSHVEGFEEHLCHDVAEALLGPVDALVRNLADSA